MAAGIAGAGAGPALCSSYSTVGASSNSARYSAAGKTGFHQLVCSLRLTTEVEVAYQMLVWVFAVARVFGCNSSASHHRPPQHF